MKTAIFSLLVFILSGCATSSIFNPYPSRIGPYLNNLVIDNSDPTLETLEKLSHSKDKALYLLEKARIEQIRNDRSSSIKDFDRVLGEVRSYDEKAIISASDLSAKTAAIITNENAIPYYPAGFERVFLHTFQALNFLAEGQIESAGVEARRANSIQQKLLDGYENELRTLGKKAESNRIDFNQTQSAIDQQLGSMKTSTSSLKNSFQNAYSFFISGMIYEALGQPNDAYIDYKKALEIYPSNRYLAESVMKTAMLLNMKDDAVSFIQSVGGYVSTIDRKSSRENGELIVMYEEGFVPQRQEIKLDLPIPTGFISFAFPIYENLNSYGQAIELVEDSISLGKGEFICDVGLLAAKALEETAPVIAVRQLLRAVMKTIIQKQAHDELGLPGTIFASLYTILSERADLRSWYTLPDKVQILHISLPPGDHQIELNQPGYDLNESHVARISVGEKLIWHVIRTGNRLYWYEYNLIN